ncbi:hypothetical protein Y032_0011g1249 [Ancylostoma ceylanicum]|uniref:Uncharacterized protein n=1 Tax=Ancylostoma ceylanicum TaxID=53326 RepID=A0A016VE40_9BILA|nr:hypothetical protein Y032_0011g1249 [Ancylostoma ceylanicum]
MRHGVYWSAFIKSNKSNIQVGVFWREVQEAGGLKTARMRAAAMAHFPGCSKQIYKGAHKVGGRREGRVSSDVIGASESGDENIEKWVHLYVRKRPLTLQQTTVGTQKYSSKVIELFDISYSIYIAENLRDQRYNNDVSASKVGGDGSTIVIRVSRRSKWGNTWRRAQRWVSTHRRPKVCKRLRTGRQMEKRCAVQTIVIILWRLNTMREYQMPGPNCDYYITHVILPASRPLLRSTLICV